ncbi:MULTISPECIES: hypothetical protein [unclassified Microcoleus]|uniref:hypothetical protein n=1 Tax=unclassified Microcoleus TaxID=2642155 RepID=UPI002FCE814B
MRVFRYRITTESLAKQITNISRFTSINDRTNRVPINHLFVNNLLPDRTFLSNSIAQKPKTRSPIHKKPGG